MKTSSLPSSSVPAVPSYSYRLFHALALLVSISAFSASVFAQAPADPNGDPNGRRRRGQNGDTAGNGGNNGGRGNFDPAAMMDRMREQLGVTDDAEWALISERLTKVTELRRGAMGGGAFGRGGPPGGGGGGNRGTRGTGNPEQDSLRQAVTDKLPDAEIKSRLERLREVRKENETKLAKAQEELRAVLSVRQEAIAVMYGMLP